METNQYHENYYLGTVVGQAMEQERIIKALDSLACNNPWCRNFGLMRTHTGCKAVRHHIKVIKGEK